MRKKQRERFYTWSDFFFNWIKTDLQAVRPGNSCHYREAKQSSKRQKAKSVWCLRKIRPVCLQSSFVPALEQGWGAATVGRWGRLGGGRFGQGLLTAVVVNTNWGFLPHLRLFSSQIKDTKFIFIISLTELELGRSQALCYFVHLPVSNPEIWFAVLCLSFSYSNWTALMASSHHPPIPCLPLSSPSSLPRDSASEPWNEAPPTSHLPSFGL